MLKDLDFCHLQEIYLTYRKQLLLDKRQDALKISSNKVVHKAVDVTDEYIGNKITDAVAKSNNDKIVKPNEDSRNIEIIILPEKEKKY